MAKPGRKRGTPSSAKLGEMRNELFRAALARRTVTYGRLMKRYGLSRGRALSDAISSIDEGEREDHAPGFASIVVRKDTGFPGGGYFVDPGLPEGVARPPGRGLDPRLSRREEVYVSAQQRKVWEFYSKGARTPATT